MEKAQDLINTLEDLMVKEFRVCQNLFSLTRDERSALSNSDVQSLTSLVERKEALLDELGQLDDSKRMTTQEIGTMLGLNSQPGQSLTVGGVLTALDSGTADRLGHLRKGILALADQVRDMTRSNHALATIALERADAVQAFLLSLYQTPPSYRPPGVPTRSGQALSWEIDHIA
jgi:flagellar biosynthesis/type III secretory pathway chaperone